MTLRQDHQLAHIDAYAIDKSDNALLLKHAGLVTTKMYADTCSRNIDKNVRRW